MMIETQQRGASSSHIIETWPTWHNRKFVLAGLLLGLAGAFLASLALGSVNIPLDDIVAILWGNTPEKATWTNIIIQFRLPKALTAMLAGSALAVSGLQMQTLFRNPLAGPFVLGINSGASLGVALVVLSVGATGGTLLAGLGLWGDFGLALAASLGAGAVLGLVLVVAGRVRNTMTLLILGLLFGYATNALVSLLLYFSIPEQIQSYITWTFGTFAEVTWDQLRVMAPVLFLGLLLSYLSAKSLNAMLLGETYARSLGLSVKQARLWTLVSASILAGTVTAFCGPIVFLGVAVPHLCRSLFNTSNHRVLIPSVILLGAILALAADIIAQMPGSQYVLPLNAIMALIGTPVVAWVILRRRNLRSSFAAT